MTRAGTARQTQQQQPPPAMVGPASGVFDSTSESDFFDLQREAGNQVVADWLKARVNNSAFQQIATPVVQQPIIQRKAANNGSADPQAETEQRTETGAVARSLIVEDDAQSVEAGQMRKSEFLTELRTATTTAAEEVLAGTMWSSMGCPYIERWFSHYEGQSAQHVERAVQRYTPEARGARNARDYIPVVTNRLRRGIEQWRETGEVPPDMPEEFASGGMPGMTAGALIGGLVGGAVSAIGGAVSSAASSIGRALFKEREGGAGEADPAAIKEQLGSGRSLDGSKSRMESAFGANFSNVRIHTDAKAHELSNSLNARAFTIGSDIAFGPGEYNPGTPVGDALIAHELAHVAQQRGADPARPLQKNRTDSSALEEDADDSAVGVVVSLWGRSKLGLGHAGQATMPSLKSGLRLQKCSSNTPAVRTPADIEREFTAVYREILGGLPEGATRDELAIDLQDIRAAYEFELQTAGNDAGKQAQLQERFHSQLETMRETAPLLVQLATRYGISFTARSSFVIQRDVAHQYHRSWTRNELQTMDAVLSRVPRNYLSNIRKIQRSPEELDPSIDPRGSTPPPDAAASWQQSSQTLRVFDLFFQQRDENERLGIILHEVGHSTVTSRPPEATGGFSSLPPDDWMRLSDWKTATSATLATSVGINAAQATQLISELTANKRTQRGRPVPVERNNRMVIYDKYEPGRDDRAPTQFLHYQKDKPFVSEYAHTHPAEDFAESFSLYLHDRPQFVLDRPAREKMGEEKWRYLETRYPQRVP